MIKEICLNKLVDRLTLLIPFGSSWKVNFWMDFFGRNIIMMETLGNFVVKQTNYFYPWKTSTNKIALAKLV